MEFICINQSIDASTVDTLLQLFERYHTISFDLEKHVLKPGKKTNSEFSFQLSTSWQKMILSILLEQSNSQDVLQCVNLIKESPAFVRYLHSSICEGFISPKVWLAFFLQGLN
jgi:hypothetical protein